MKKSLVILLHSGYWLLYCFLFTFLFTLSRATSQNAFAEWEDWLAIIIFAFFAGFASFYTFYFWIVPRFLATRQIRLFVGVGLLAGISVAFISTLLVSLSVTAIVYFTLHQTQFLLFDVGDELGLLAGFTLLALVNGAISTMISGFITWYNDIHLKEITTAKNLRTELALLKAQINPHFLFNTLNNIDVLIEHDPARASLYLNDLSGLLRFVIYETQADLIPLQLEIDYIKKYIELQKIRTANASYVTFLIEGEADNYTIAPMLLIPFIENAFKFAPTKSNQEAINIKIRINESGVLFQCGNVIGAANPGSTEYGGLGNKLLRQRLALLYPEKYSLLIGNDDQTYHVELKLALNTHEMSVN